MCRRTEEPPPAAAGIGAQFPSLTRHRLTERKQILGTEVGKFQHVVLKVPASQWI